MDGDVATPRTPGTVCPSSPTIVNVTGTANAPLGYRIRKLPRPHLKKKPRTPPDVRYPEITKALATDCMIGLLIQDERRHERKLISKGVQKKVDQGIEAYEEDLEVRRDKLRRMLLEEEADLVRELVEVVKKLEAERADELTAQTMLAERERETARQELLHEKQLQLFLQNNAELREMRKQARMVDAKRANVIQMADNLQRRRLECDEEAFWDQLMLDRSKAELDADAKAALVRAEENQNVSKTLLSQINAKADYSPPDVSIDKNIKILPTCNPLIEKEIQQVKNRKFREDLETQLLQTKRSLEKRRCEEKALNEMSFALQMPSDASVTDQKHIREAKRKEMLSYMESLQGFREALARREAEAEEHGRLLAEAVSAEKAAALRQAKESRRLLDRELKLAWDRQLEDKCSRQESELRPGVQPDYDFEQPSPSQKLKIEEKQQRRRAALAYGRELLEQQQEHEERLAQEERSQEEGFQRLIAEQEDKERDFAEEVDQLGSHLRIANIP